jgi:hypothetical protein
MILYAVVYGNSWEDIEYFHSYAKACTKLIIQTLGMKHGGNSFHPMLMEYVTSDHGEMGRTKNMMAITDLKTFFDIDKDQIIYNSESVFDMIKSIF